MRTAGAQTLEEKSSKVPRGRTAEGADLKKFFSEGFPAVGGRSGRGQKPWEIFFPGFTPSRCGRPGAQKPRQKIIEVSLPRAGGRGADPRSKLVEGSPAVGGAVGAVGTAGARVSLPSFYSRQGELGFSIVFFLFLFRPPDGISPPFSGGGGSPPGSP